MKRIPKAYQLGSHTVTVQILNQAQWEALTEDYDIEGAVGAWRYEDHAIIILKEQTEPMRFHTFAHELTHSILDAMGDRVSKKLNSNELWVDRFANFLAQALKSAK